MVGWITAKNRHRLVRGSLCIGHFIPKVHGIFCDKIATGAVKPTYHAEKSRREAVFVGRIEQDTGIMEYMKALDILRGKHGLSMSLTVCVAMAASEERSLPWENHWLSMSSSWDRCQDLARIPGGLAIYTH